MRIGLIDVDGKDFPNLALMKISAHHKALGDSVEWANFFEEYDKVYYSKVFTFTEDEATYIKAKEIIKGGTGYDYKISLPKEIDFILPDYSIYPQYPRAYGFLTRGCIRKCSWCIVPKKEGKIRPCKDIEEVLQGRKEAVLMDNNILACDYGIKQIEKIVKLKCKVDFNQGLDARLVTDDIAKLLSKVKWLKQIRFACDTQEAIDPLLSALEKLNKYGIKNYKIFVYLLVKDVAEANKRSEIMKKLGVDPFTQPYRDFENNIAPTKEQQRFARYVNHKAIYKSINWEEYTG